MIASGPDIQMWVTLALVILTIGAFTLERLPLQASAAAILAILLVYFELSPVIDADGVNVLDAKRLLEGFANPALITVLALLVIGQAMIQTGALEGAATGLHLLSRGSATRGLAISLILAGAVSSVLNNTPVVVIMIPVISGFAERLGISVSRLLIPLSFASMLGGMTTLIGSSTNLLVSGVGADLGEPSIGFFDFLVPGAVIAATGLVYVILIAPRLLPDRAPMARHLAVGGRQFIAQVEVLPGSSLVGERPIAGMFRQLPEMTVRLIQRGEHAILPPFEGFALEPGDVVIVAATRKALTDALARHPRALHPSFTRRQIRAQERSPDGSDKAPWQGGEQALAEVMVTPASRLIGRDLEMIGFRHQLGCIVLGVQRRTRMIRARVTEIRLEAGDVLLIQGPPEKVRALRENRDILLIEWSQTALPSYDHARRAALIFGAVVVAAASGLVPIVVAAFAGACTMVLAGCLNIRQAARAIDSRVVMTVAATLALGAALQATGGAAFIANSILTTVHGYGPGMVLVVLFGLVALLTNVLSNNASAVLFTPIAISAAHSLGADPAVFLYTIIFGASCAFVLPIGYQTNLLVMAPGHYRMIDFVRTGLPLTFLVWVAFSIFVPWYYGLQIWSA